MVGPRTVHHVVEVEVQGWTVHSVLCWLVDKTKAAAKALLAIPGTPTDDSLSNARPIQIQRLSIEQDMQRMHLNRANISIALTCSDTPHKTKMF